MTLVAVLAGGASRRMGAPKACVELGGRPLISYPLEAAAAAGLSAVVVAKDASSAVMAKVSGGHGSDSRPAGPGAPAPDEPGTTVPSI